MDPLVIAELRKGKTMSAKSKISWTDATWNPVGGCTRVSPGCQHCYAQRLAGTRLREHPRYRGLAILGPPPRWTGKIRLHSDLLQLPLGWKKPRRIFVNSMSDLFHGSVPWAFIDQVFSIMAACPQHTFQILTKRPRAMEAWVSGSMYRVLDHFRSNYPERCVPCWPLPNVWLGVSAENQEYARRRIPALLRTPAAVRFASLEPLLGPVRLRGRWLRHADGGLDWVIVGGESGPGARPFDLDWGADIREQCRGACAFYFKQAGSRPVLDGPVPVELKSASGSDPEEWPSDLRVQQFPGQEKK